MVISYPSRSWPSVSLSWGSYSVPDSQWPSVFLLRDLYLASEGHGLEYLYPEGYIPPLRLMTFSISIPWIIIHLGGSFSRSMTLSSSILRVISHPRVSCPTVSLSWGSYLAREEHIPPLKINYLQYFYLEGHIPPLRVISHPWGKFTPIAHFPTLESAHKLVTHTQY